jgi:hypothetical protein
MLSPLPWQLAFGAGIDGHLSGFDEADDQEEAWSS